MKLSALAMGLACLASTATAMAHENGTIKIYDGKYMTQIGSLSKKGKLVLEDGVKKFLIQPKTAQILNDNLEKIRDFFAEEFNRKSWDDKGADIEATLNVNRYTLVDILGQNQNASWRETRFTFGAGKEKGLDNFEKALDVVGHEYTHAVIQTTSKLKYEGQSGALNEHLADVFGIIINDLNNSPKNPFLIGSTILNGRYSQKAEALRDMMEPSKGLTPQPAHMDDLKTAKFKMYAEDCKEPTSENDRCGVHVLSGIPNKMAALVIKTIGPKAAAPLFYNVMTKRLSENSNFADYREALMQECKSMPADTCSIVDESLKAVGI